MDHNPLTAAPIDGTTLYIISEILNGEDKTSDLGQDSLVFRSLEDVKNYLKETDQLEGYVAIFEIKAIEKIELKMVNELISHPLPPAKKDNKDPKKVINPTTKKK